MRLHYALFCAAMLAWQPTVHAAPKVPLSAFVQEDQYSQPRLAPDGKHIAIVVRIPSGERFVPAVITYALPDMKMTGAVRLPVFEVPLAHYWVSNTRLVIAKGKELGSREQPVATGEVLAVEYDGTKQEYLYGHDMFKASRRGDRYGDDYGYGEIEDVDHARDDHLFLTSHLWRTDRSQLYDIDTRSAIRALVADLPLPHLGFVLQHSGAPRFAYGADENGYAVLFRRDDARGAWNKVTRDFGRKYEPLAFSSDDSEFVAYHSKTGGPVALIREKLASGERTTLFEDAVGDAVGLQYGPGSKLPFAAHASVGIPVTRYFDDKAEDAQLHKLLSAQFPGSHVQFIDFSKDGKLLLFGVQSDRDPGSYYLFNKTAGKADLLFSGMDAIDPDQMAERRPVSFAARDGLALHGFMTMPARAPGSPAPPLVLLPHGGPHGPYDNWFFDADAQFLASRGYAVLQVNFRGSGGRGVAFKESGYRQWGAQIQDDLVDGVKWAIAQGQADGKRVCVYGASFGGYSALMLAARDPALFKCAIGYAGVYDLNLLHTEERALRSKTYRNIVKRYVGDDKAELDRFSPVTQAARITAPVLLIHGGKDKIAPVEHAEAMRAALVKAGRAPEWLLAPNEGHGFYDTRNLTEFYTRLESFLAKHIGQ